MAALLPNVEFVFGLAGSTASTLMAFILPAAIFLSVTSAAQQRGSMLGNSIDMLRGEEVVGVRVKALAPAAQCPCLSVRRGHLWVRQSSLLLLAC